MTVQFPLNRAMGIAFFLIATILIFTSCKKEEGKGGLATIKGRVLEYKIDGTGDVVDTSYAVGKKVYISYGDHEWVDDDARTSYTGEYAFQWLQKGDYRVWVEGGCSFCPDSLQIDVATVTVNGKKETVTARDLIRYND